MNCIRYILVNEYGYVEEVPRIDLLGVIIPREEFEAQQRVRTLLQEGKRLVDNDKRINDLGKAFKKAARREREKTKETDK